MPVLHSIQFGEGDSHLIVLHGFLGMGDNWKTHAKVWAEKGWKVHLIDQRNHGRSFWSDEFSYSLMATDLADYMEFHHIQKATLLGHSMGGKVVMNFACQFPDKVIRLIVADIAPKAYSPHHQQILNGLKSLDFSQINSRNEADLFLKKYVQDEGTRQFLLKNVYRVTPTQLGLRLNIKVLAEANELIGKSLNKNDQYQGPTLFLKGANSGYILEHDILTIQHHFPISEVIEIPDAGHWLHAENPLVFRIAIENWWNN